MALAVTPGWIDAILVAIAIEFVAVSLVLYRTAVPMLITPWFLYLASGALLMVALRAQLVESPPIWIALALLMSGIAHGASIAWLLHARSRLGWRL